MWGKSRILTNRERKELDELGELGVKLGLFNVVILLSDFELCALDCLPFPDHPTANGR